MLPYLTHTTGIRVTELALLEVGDLLHPGGAIKPEAYLRVEITKGCRARNIYLTQPRCLNAIEQWIGVRLRRGWSISSEAEYRGLRPDSRLVMTTRARPSSWHSSIVSWRAAPKCIGPTKRSNRRSAGCTGRPALN